MEYNSNIHKVWLSELMLSIASLVFRLQLVGKPWIIARGASVITLKVTFMLAV